jgi:hypothetical protein
MLLIRATTIVLLASNRKTFAFIYLSGDLGLYLLIKLVRQDFWYWMPLGGKKEIVSSLLNRIVVKVITDFTAIAQFRHPNEMGGLAWTFSFLLTMASLPVAIVLTRDNEGKLEGVRGPLASAALIYVLPATCLAFLFFLSNMEKKYIYTFLSRTRGRDLCIKMFRESTRDNDRAERFRCSRHYWQAIESEVKAWVQNNWDHWQVDKPKWLDEDMRSRIPIEFIPVKRDSFIKGKTVPSPVNNTTLTLQAPRRSAKDKMKDAGKIMPVLESLRNDFEEKG